MYAYPRDLFYDLGLRLAPESVGNAARERFARRFQRARIRAEKIANWCARRMGREHADIMAIYRLLIRLIRVEHPLLDLVRAELAVEEENLYVIEETLDKIRDLRAAGHCILFVSDMYVPACWLAPILQRLGVMQDGDKLYVSCDVGVSKHSGGLFRHVLKAERLIPAQWLHTGDNIHADIHMAQRLGIQVRHFTDAHLMPREELIAGSRIPRDPSASWLVAFSRRCRLAMPHNEADHALDGVIFGVIVPFLLTYVLWLVNDASRRGIRRLYFVARDGEILLKIARELNPEEIELRYLYGSRRAWIPPSILCDGEIWQSSVIMTGRMYSAADIVARMGIGESQAQVIQRVMQLSDNQWRELLTIDGAYEFLRVLRRSTNAWQVVTDTLVGERERVVAYFQQEGLCEDVSWALVDVGWALNAQGALQKILSVCTETCEQVRGFYLALAKRHLEVRQAGRAFAFVSNPGSFFSRRAIVMEYLFCPPTHPSTKSYKLCEGQVGPEFDIFQVSERNIQYAQRLHDAAVIAARMVATDTRVAAKFQTNSDYIARQAKSFICKPLRTEAMAAVELQANADMRHEQRWVNPLVRPLRMSDIMTVVYSTVCRVNKTSSLSVAWFEGAAEISSGPTRWLAKLLARIDAYRGKIVLRDEKTNEMS